MAPLRGLLRLIVLAVVLLSASLGQQRSSPRSLASSRKSFVNTQQWYFSRGRAKMQTGGVSSANRRLVRADTGSQPIAFANPQGPGNRNTGQAIGFAGNSNPPLTGDRAAQPQGEAPSPTNPLTPNAGGIIDPVPHQETDINLAGFITDSTPHASTASEPPPPPPSPDSDLQIVRPPSNDGIIAPPSVGSLPSAPGPGGGAGNNVINQPQDPTSSGGPDNKSRTFRTREKPRCANNGRANPCEADGDYNEEIAERVRGILRDSRMNAIIENSAVNELLQDSALVKDKTFLSGPSVRFGPEGDFVSETPACRAQESIIYPQRAKTTSDDWVFVINQDTVKQGVRVEKCIREGQTCDLGVGQTPTIRTTCRQKFIYRKLLVLSDSGSDVQPESVLIPSCCVCYIRRLDELVSGRIFNVSQAATTMMPGYDN